MVETILDLSHVQVSLSRNIPVIEPSESDPTRQVSRVWAASKVGPCKVRCLVVYGSLVLSLGYHPQQIVGHQATESSIWMNEENQKGQSDWIYSRWASPTWRNPVDGWSWWAGKISLSVLPKLIRPINPICGIQERKKETKTEYKGLARGWVSTYVQHRFGFGLVVRFRSRSRSPPLSSSNSHLLKLFNRSIPLHQVCICSAWIIFSWWGKNSIVQDYSVWLLHLLLIDQSCTIPWLDNLSSRLGTSAYTRILSLSQSDVDREFLAKNLDLEDIRGCAFRPYRQLRSSSPMTLLLLFRGLVLGTKTTSPLHYPTCFFMQVADVQLTFEY